MGLPEYFGPNSTAYILVLCNFVRPCSDRILVLSKIAIVVPLNKLVRTYLTVHHTLVIPGMSGRTVLDDQIACWLNILAVSICLTQAVWRPEVIKRQTLGSTYVQFAVEEVTPPPIDQFQFTLKANSYNNLILFIDSFHCVQQKQRNKYVA